MLTAPESGALVAVGSLVDIGTADAAADIGLAERLVGADNVGGVVDVGEEGTVVGGYMLETAGESHSELVR